MTKRNFLEAARLAAKTADDKKGSDIAILNVKRFTSVAEYFLIITAHSEPHINALMDIICKTLKEDAGLSPIHKETAKITTWSVIDYGGLIVHIMLPDTRTTYALEKIWDEAKAVK